MVARQQPLRDDDMLDFVSHLKYGGYGEMGKKAACGYLEDERNLPLGMMQHSENQPGYGNALV